MPLYEYQCRKCGHRFERLQKFADKSVTQCPKCKGKVERLISSPAIQFKGSGFYSTDYGARTTSRDPAEPTAEAASKAAKEKESAKKEPAKEAPKDKKEAKSKPTGKS